MWQLSWQDANADNRKLLENITRHNAGAEYAIIYFEVIPASQPHGARIRRSTRRLMCWLFLVVIGHQTVE